ncbi:unnamed protein product [Choristocarpus tenellus]
MCRFLPKILQGPAETFYFQALAGTVEWRSTSDLVRLQSSLDVPIPITPPKTWEDVQKALITAFTPAHAVFVSARRLMSLKQGENESVDQYTLRCTAAMNLFWMMFIA